MTLAYVHVDVFCEAPYSGNSLPVFPDARGLRYLIVPVAQGTLERARITTDISGLLHDLKAEFAVVLDEASLEMRHWTNDSTIEDEATGSAVGAVGAYRPRHGLAQGGDVFILNRGRFTGRPSRLRVQAEDTSRFARTVKVVGDVRSGSVKRVAAAIGEGSMAVRLLFDRLQASGAAAAIAPSPGR